MHIGTTHLVYGTTLTRELLPNAPDHLFTVTETIADTYRQAECNRDRRDICVVDNYEQFCSPYHYCDLNEILSGRALGGITVLLIPTAGGQFFAAVIQPLSTE